MVLGIVMALSQDDLKRLLAYSSVSQMGYVLAGVGLGTYLGCYGGLYHLLNHALYKSLLFLCVGAVISCHRRAANKRTRRIETSYAHHERLFSSGRVGDRRLPAAQRILEQADDLSGAGEGRAVVGGYHSRRDQHFDHGRHGSGRVQSVLGRAGGQHGSELAVREVPAVMWVPMASFGDIVRVAWRLPPSAVSTAGSSGGGSGDPGQVMERCEVSRV